MPVCLMYTMLKGKRKGKLAELNILVTDGKTGFPLRHARCGKGHWAKHFIDGNVHIHERTVHCCLARTTIIICDSIRDIDIDAYELGPSSLIKISKTRVPLSDADLCAAFGPEFDEHGDEQVCLPHCPVKEDRLVLVVSTVAKGTRPCTMCMAMSPENVI